MRGTAPVTKPTDPRLLASSYVGAALVHLEPAARDRKIEPGFVFGRAASQVVEKRPVDQLDEDAAVLNGFDAVGDLHQLFRGDFRIREGAGIDKHGRVIGSADLESPRPRKHVQPL
jgi:hypothetical protein